MTGGFDRVRPRRRQIGLREDRIALESLVGAVDFAAAEDDFGMMLVRSRATLGGNQIVPTVLLESELRWMSPLGRP